MELFREMFVIQKISPCGDGDDDVALTRFSWVSKTDRAISTVEERENKL